MADGRLRAFLLVALAACAVAVVLPVLPVPCEPPISAETCAAIRVACLQITPEQCADSSGTFVSRGGMCGYCDLCVRYVGEGQTCNQTQVATSPGTVGVTNICQSPLICSARSNGRCVRERNCLWVS